MCTALDPVRYFDDTTGTTFVDTLQTAAVDPPASGRRRRQVDEDITSSFNSTMAVVILPPNSPGKSNRTV